MRIVLEVECKILCFLKYDILCSIKSFCAMMKGCGQQHLLLRCGLSPELLNPFSVIFKQGLWNLAKLFVVFCVFKIHYFGVIVLVLFLESVHE